MENANRSMKDSKSHQEYAAEYKQITSWHKKDNQKNCIRDFGIVTCLYFISGMQESYAKVLAVILFCLGLFFIGQEYSKSRDFDKKIVGTILKGLELEKKNSGFFHETLSKLPIVRLLVARSIWTGMYVCFLGAMMNKIFFGEWPDRVIFCVVYSIATLVTVCLYYRFYGPLDEAKSTQKA